jgi:hypothetical protein
MFKVTSLPGYIFMRYMKSLFMPIYPEPKMWCLWCQIFGHIQQQCASNLVCDVCGKSGLGESPCPNPLHCNDFGTHISSNRTCLVFLDKVNIQQPWSKRVFPFSVPRRSSLKANLRLALRSYASLFAICKELMPQHRLQLYPTKAKLQHIQHTTPPWITVCTQSENLPAPPITCVKVHVYQRPALDIPQSRIIRENVWLKKSCQSSSHPGTQKSCMTQLPYLTAVSPPFRYVWLMGESHRCSKVQIQREMGEISL